MSTRCQIQIEGSDCYIYQHSDGYPSGVLPTVMPFVARFLKARGHDPSYLTARLLSHMICENDKEMLKYSVPTGYACTGFGIDTTLHGDVDYLYTVTKEGTIKVQGIGLNSDYTFSFRHLGEFSASLNPENVVKDLELLNH